MTARRARLLNLLLPALVGGAVMAALIANASADTGTSDPGAVDDVFSAGRRAGFLWLALGLFATVIFRAILVRLKPKDGAPPRPGSWRGRLSIVVGGALAVATAAIDMFASSRGLAPIATAATGAILLYYGAADDPARGSKRADVAGETEGPPT